jgi:glycosyltransferase involved in cell wall biosynthesis
LFQSIKHIFIKFIQRVGSYDNPTDDADISFFHDFVSPPTGGGHQFLRALWREFERRGIRLENNTISKTTEACIFNSFNFNFRRLRQLHRPGCRMIHRVDGPLAVYRGFDDGTDREIWKISSELADATVFQSQFSLIKHRELGFDFNNPIIIPNAVDPAIFHSQDRIQFSDKRKTRLISVSWSDNINKGAPVYQWLDDNLDWSKYEYTFVGRSPVTFSNIRTMPPITSDKLAKELRQHDIFITASRNDPCSNSLLEALACGLPALYLDSGGHSEIVGKAGFAFKNTAEIPDLLFRLITEYSLRQGLIRLFSIAETADKYLNVMLGTIN